MARLAKARTSGGSRRTKSRTLVRWIVLTVVGAYLLVPLLSMLDFSTRGVGSSRTLEAWKAIASYPELLSAITVTLELAVLTVVGMLCLLVPTMVWVHLRLPGVRRTMEFFCLLPLTIPAIVLVVGLAPVFSWLSYFFGDTPLVLAFVFVVLVLPYAYRAVDAGLRAVDIETLSEAALGLGASWWGTLFRIVIPSIRGALLSAAVLSIALVMGEYTIASLLNYNTLQVVLYQVGLRNAAVSVAVSLAALIFGFVLLFIVSSAGSRRRGAAREESTLAPLEGGLQ
ncbi:MAG: ABC transporter permease subunit [Actinobacteria bacterium]|nr:ABC transporter permease subunit [Actinomycetota bacterium]